MTYTLQLLEESDRVRVCIVLAGLLLVDGKLEKSELLFLEGIMTESGFDRATQARVWQQARDAKDFSGDIEQLRRSGAGNALLSMLNQAAYADGVLDEAEVEMIAQVRETIRLRLGAERFPVKLEGLSRAPLSERYIVEGLLGEGGFGTVDLARTRETDARVVIKKLRMELAAALAPEQREAIEDRFWREVKVIGELQSPYSVRLLDAGFDVDTPYMVLEHVAGETLGDRIKRQRLTASQAARVLSQALDAIADAHAKGVIHRDLKPENIMVMGADDALEIRVLDYGLAGILSGFEDNAHVTITTEGQTLGTPGYMPPEQILEFAERRPQNDLYALGLILYECLTGRPGVRSRSNLEAITWQISEAELQIPPELDASGFGALIHEACRKDWKKRFSSAEAMRSALSRVDLEAADAALEGWSPGETARDIEHDPTLAAATLPRVEDTPSASKRPWIAAGVVALVLLVVLWMMVGCSTSRATAEPAVEAPSSEAAEMTEVDALLRTHAARYPRMQAQDLYKLLHHRAMGPAHAIADVAHARAWMTREIASLSPATRIEVEVEVLDVARGVARIHLRPWLAKGRDPERLLRAFVESANTLHRDRAVFERALERALTQLPELGLDLDAEGFAAFVAARREEGFPAVHHSDVFRSEYHPAYRVVSLDQLLPEEPPIEKKNVTPRPPRSIENQRRTTRPDGADRGALLQHGGHGTGVPGEL